MRFFIGLLLITIFSCKQSNRSAIEVIQFDKKVIDSLKASSDTFYTVQMGRTDFYFADYYINRIDGITSRIYKDSLNNVVGFIKIKNGERFFAEEYYPNGQLITKTAFPPGKIEGPVTHYYPDGRIESTGQWQDSKQSGIWKHYDEQGKPNKTVYYDNNGNITKTEVEKTSE